MKEKERTARAHETNAAPARSAWCNASPPTSSSKTKSQEVLWRQGAVPARRGASVEGRQRGQRRAIRERSDHRRVSSHEKHGRRRSRDLVVSGTVYGSVSRCIEVRALLGHITMHHFQERQPQRRATANDTLQLSQRALTITVSRSSVPQRVHVLAG